MAWSPPRPGRSRRERGARDARQLFSEQAGASEGRPGPLCSRPPRRGPRIAFARDVFGRRGGQKCGFPLPFSVLPSVSTQQLLKMTSTSTVSRFFPLLTVKHVIFSLEFKLSLSCIKNGAAASVRKPSFHASTGPAWAWARVLAGSVLLVGSPGPVRGVSRRPFG